MRLLYVEDSESDGDQVRRALARATPDYHLDIVPTLREAMTRLADNTTYDLVLTDLRLPDGSGLDLLTHIRERDLNIAVVVITGSGDEETALGALKTGADDYVVKRAGYLDRLPLVLEDALNRQRARVARGVRPLRVLYAEHNDIDIDLTRRHMAQHAPHIKLAVVHTAPEAFHRLATGTGSGVAPYDVVLLDYRLPGLNALEALKEIRQGLRLSIPVVFVTGQGDEEIALQALKLGAADYIPKHSGYLYQLPGVLKDVHQRAELAQEQAALLASERAEHEQRELAEALRSTATAMVGTLSLSEVLDRILAQAARVVPYEAGTIMLVRGDRARIVRSSGFVERGIENLLDIDLALAGTPNLRLMQQTGQPMAITDTHAYAGWLEVAGTAWARSYAGAPIRVKGAIIGFLNLDSSVPGFYSQAQAERLQAFADQAAIAVDNARLYDELQRRADDLEQRVAERTAELSEANAKLEELNRTKSDFVSNVSHELRTPLSNILNYLDLLEIGRPEKRSQYMATLRREAQLLQQQIEDLLQLSRLDLGKAELVFTPVDVNALITLLATDRGTLFDDRGLALDLRLDRHLSSTLADPGMLIQVLTNLMTNAMNYTPRGGTVTVSTAVQRRSPGEAADQVSLHWTTCSVADTGRGIAQEEQVKVFQRFYRGNAGRESGAPGTGLGLAICQEIIARHGGKITLDSQVGNGSTFTIWLPAEDGETAQASGLTPAA
jgi:signal transduction histidine kinase/DNA-binding response OmpR family regulator